MNYKPFAAGAAVMLLSYLTGAFIAADFNIANWLPFGRLMTGIAGAAFGLVAWMYVDALE